MRVVLFALLRLVCAPVGMESVRTTLKATVKRMCSASRTQNATSQQACVDASRFQKALGEAGRQLSVADDEPWPVLEGDALLRHPDPLGALQRGEVPAVMLRKFVPADELRHMLSKKVAQLTKVIFHLNTKNEDQETRLVNMQAAYEAEIDRIVEDAAAKLKQATQDYE